MHIEFAFHIPHMKSSKPAISNITYNLNNKKKKSKSARKEYIMLIPSSETLNHIFVQMFFSFAFLTNFSYFIFAHFGPKPLFVRLYYIILIIINI